MLIKRSSVEHSRPGGWDLPGGECDKGETLETAITREIYEEVGLKVHALQLIGAAQLYHTEKAQHRIFLNWGAMVQFTNVHLSNEHTDYLWVEPNKVTEYLQEHEMWERVLGLIECGLLATYLQNATSA